MNSFHNNNECDEWSSGVLFDHRKYRKQQQHRQQRIRRYSYTNNATHKTINRIGVLVVAVCVFGIAAYMKTSTTKAHHLHLHDTNSEFNAHSLVLERWASKDILEADPNNDTCIGSAYRLPNGTNWTTISCDHYHDFKHDECLFITCATDCEPDGGFIDYMRFPYCVMKSGGGGVVVFVLWIIFLFIALGLAAEEFFCPALSVISDTLKLSDNVAGVTFLAFGNGAPDIFSVYSSIMQGDGNSGTALALGELYGAGMFVTTVVVGTIGCFVEFRLTRRPFIRDVVCYLVAALWAFVVIFDGDITLGESIGFVGVYVGYVLVVVIGRRIYQAQKAKRGLVPEETPKHLEEEMTTSPRASRAMAIYEDDDELIDDVGTGMHINNSPRTLGNKTIAEALGTSEDLALSTAQAIMRSESLMATKKEKDERGKPPKMDDIYEDDDDIDNNETQELIKNAEEYLDADEPVVGRTAMLEAKKEPLSEFLEAIFPIDMEEFRETQWYWKIYAIMQAPILLFMTITIPVVDLDVHDRNWKQYLQALQCFTAPVFAVAGAGFGGVLLGGVYPLLALVGAVGIVFAFALLGATEAKRPPERHNAFAFLGFFVSVVWIYCVANEIVNVLQVIGRIMHISDAILGLTVLAWGNSIGDFVSNLTVARQGYPQMAFGACFGGPALNMLLGVGLSCTAACLSKKNPYPVEQVTNLKVSGGFLLFSLVSSLTIVPINNFIVKRRYGLFMIMIYVAFVGTSLYVEIKGL
eukprot:m.343244 g.343244  ORF g.343244 m.343244 type:complete len:751 (+) comp22547_c0_seq1:366-2618(+)